MQIRIDGSEAAKFVGECVVVREDAVGAWPRGTRVRKIASVPSDTHRDGACATVVGSMGPVDYGERLNTYGYFVEWDDMPGIPVMISSWRIEPC